MNGTSAHLLLIVSFVILKGEWCGGYKHHTKMGVKKKVGWVFFFFKKKENLLTAEDTIQKQYVLNKSKGYYLRGVNACFRRKK